MDLPPEAVRVAYDEEADAVYVQVRPTKQSHTQFPDGILGGRYIHCDASGRIRGFEFVAVSRGTNLFGLPEPEASMATAALRQAGLAVHYELPPPPVPDPPPDEEEGERDDAEAGAS